MTAFFKLIRWQNLLIVAATMVLMRYAIIQPVLENTPVKLYTIAGDASTMMLQLPLIDFIILVAATVFLTAGGYVINDYFDIKTDLINKGKVLVGTSIPRLRAMAIHNTLNILGVAAGFYVSWKAGYFAMGVLFLLVSGLLYFYSATYKRQFLIGNIIVAALTAMVPMLVILYEAPLLYQYYSVNAIETPSLKGLFLWVGGFAVFAFLTTLAREIIKDIEDFEGDVAYGRNTIPVVAGIVASKIIAITIIIVTIILLYLVWFLFLNDAISFIYLTAAVEIPLLFVIWQVWTSSGRKQLHSASGLMKVIMLTGILYAMLVKVLFIYNIL